MANKESIITLGNFFGYSVTLDNRFVTSNNSINDFPDDFVILGDLTLISLKASDFPVSDPIV